MGENVVTNEEKTDLFYKMISRRPLIDVVQEKEEEEFWTKNFSDANDITLYSWRNDWLKNIKGNLEHYGYFDRDHSVKVFANELLDRAVILVGAGPSLQENIDYLKLAKEKGVKIFASHHALMYLAERGIKPDYVCVLDAGHMWDDYFAFDKMDYTDVPLLADQVCNTEQLKQWKGNVFFYQSAYPDKSVVGKFLKMELGRIYDFKHAGSLIEVGGHAMGAMISLAKGVMNANTLIFIGADYCFNSQGKFYPFDHDVDKLVEGTPFGQPGVMLPATPPPQGQIFDIFGNVVYTNGAYLGFKNVMDQSIRVNKMAALQQNQDVDFINATEGGALGALKGGLSKWMLYLRLEDAIHFAVNKIIVKEGKV
jgi:hypothetical protein